MSRYIALFRGINVGGRNKITMKALAAMMQECGCEEIRTYIQSGNVVFRHQGEPPVDQIIQRIDAAHGFSPELLILDRPAFQTAIDNNPYPDAEGKSCHFNFCRRTPDSVDTARLEQLKSSTEHYALIGTVFYLHAPDGIGRSKLAGQVEKCLGVPATGRNLNTVRKLADLLDQ